MDVTTIALAGLTTLGFMVYWLTRLRQVTDRDKRREPSPTDLRRVMRD